MSVCGGQHYSLPEIHYTKKKENEEQESSVWLVFNIFLLQSMFYCEAALLMNLAVICLCLFLTFCEYRTLNMCTCFVCLPLAANVNISMLALMQQH